VASDSRTFALRLALLEAEELDGTPFGGGGRRVRKDGRRRTTLGRLSARRP
jgi:hypothetical protein